MRIDIVLCEKADDNLRNYINVFDEIFFEKHEKLSFTAVCKLKFEGDRSEEIILHFFLISENEGKEKGLYLAEVSIVRTDEDLNLDEDTFKMEFKDIPMIERGVKYLKVVREDSIKDTNSEQGVEIYRIGEHIGEAEFWVR